VATPSLQEIVCCMGQPVAGNPTQYMMEKAFAAAGMDWRYLTLEIPPQALCDAARGMKAMGLRGGNFTLPHKVAIIEYLDGLSEAAELMGAVNCVNRDGDRYIGENTDGKGFVQSLRDVTDPAEKRIVILGAGGAARAIAVELGLERASHLTIVSRSPDRGGELVELLQGRVHVDASLVVWDGDFAVPVETEVLINATSIGHLDARARVPLSASTLRPGLVVADVIINPPHTQFLRTATDCGCTTLDGLGMLINQAVISFRIWTGFDPDADVMREALEEFLEL